MTKHFVTLPASGPEPERTLIGLGTFRRGVPRELDLAPGQVAALRGKRFDVAPVDPDGDPPVLPSALDLDTAAAVATYLEHEVRDPDADDPPPTPSKRPAARSAERKVNHD